VASDQEFVSAVQALEQAEFRDAVGFALFASIARNAGEHKIPDTIEIVREVSVERPGEEMIDVDLAVGTGEIDPGVAIKAMSFLVAVERRAGRGYGYPAGEPLYGEGFAGGIKFNQGAAEADFPGGFDQAPARFVFHSEAGSLVAGAQRAQIISEADRFGGGAFVDEKTAIEVGGAEPVEGVDDVVETVTDGEGAQGGFVDLAGIEGAAAVEEAAGGAGGLFGGCFQMFADTGGKREGEVFKGDAVIGAIAEFEQGAAEGEFVGGHVAAEKAEGTPAVFECWLDLEEGRGQREVGPFAGDGLRLAGLGVKSRGGAGLMRGWFGVSAGGSHKNL